MFIKIVTAKNATIFRKGRKLRVFVFCELCVFFANFAVKICLVNKI